MGHRPGQYSQRGHEPTEQLRAERRRKGQCRDCGADANGKLRCTTCNRKAEQATNRYRSGAKPGRQSMIVTDLRDLRFSAEELSKAYAGMLEAEARGQARKREELIAEPMHHAHLAWKFLGEVLDRSGIFPTKKPAKRVKQKRGAKAPGRFVQLTLALGSVT
jgi:hypothetical protein